MFGVLRKEQNLKFLRNYILILMNRVSGQWGKLRYFELHDL